MKVLIVAGEVAAPRIEKALKALGLEYYHAKTAHALRSSPEWHRQFGITVLHKRYPPRSNEMRLTNILAIIRSKAGDDARIIVDYDGHIPPVDPPSENPIFVSNTNPETLAEAIEKLMAFQPE